VRSGAERGEGDAVTAGRREQDGDAADFGAALPVPAWLLDEEPEGGGAPGGDEGRVAAPEGAGNADEARATAAGASKSSGEGGRETGPTDGRPRESSAGEGMDGVADYARTDFTHVDDGVRGAALGESGADRVSAIGDGGEPQPAPETLGSSAGPGGVNRQAAASSPAPHTDGRDTGAEARATGDGARDVGIAPAPAPPIAEPRTPGPRADTGGGGGSGQPPRAPEASGVGVGSGEPGVPVGSSPPATQAEEARAAGGDSARRAPAADRTSQLPSPQAPDSAAWRDLDSVATPHPRSSAEEPTAPSAGGPWGPPSVPPPPRPPAHQPATATGAFAPPAGPRFEAPAPPGTPGGDTQAWAAGGVPDAGPSAPAAAGASPAAESTSRSTQPTALQPPYADQPLGGNVPQARPASSDASAPGSTQPPAPQSPTPGGSESRSAQPPPPDASVRWDTPSAPPTSSAHLEPDPFPAAAYTTPRGATNTAEHDDGATRVIGFHGDQAWEEAGARPALFRRLVIVGVVVGILVIAFVVVALVHRGGSGADDKRSPEPSANATTSGAKPGPPVLPAQAPPGWSKNAAWIATVAVPTAKAPTVAASTTAVAVITTDGKVALLDPATGHVRRAFDLPAGEHRGVRLALVDRVESVLVQAGNQLAYAPADGSAAPTVLDLPDNAQVSYAGDAPLVVAGAAASVVEDAKLVPVGLPANATAMAADGATVIAAVPVGPWWSAAPGREPVAVTPVPPRAGATIFRIAAAGHNRVAVIWNGPDATTVTVVLYDATSGQSLVTTDAPLDQVRKTAWVWGTDGRVAALGPVVYDLQANKASVRPGFGPVVGWGKLLYGQSISDPQTTLVLDATDPAKAPTPLGAGVPLPWGGPTGQLLLILDSTPTTTPTLYALTPAPR
jgi:hypothetical protein